MNWKTPLIDKLSRKNNEKYYTVIRKDNAVIICMKYIHAKHLSRAYFIDDNGYMASISDIKGYMFTSEFKKQILKDFNKNLIELMRDKSKVVR